MTQISKRKSRNWKKPWIPGKCSPLLLPENCWNPGRLSEISLDDFYDSMPIMTSGTDGTPLPWRMTL